LKPIPKDPGSFGVLTPGHKAVLEIFFALKESEDFCLSGGTALAEYYLGHRRSFDLDFITRRDDLVPTFSRRLEQALAEKFTTLVPRRFLSFAELQTQIGAEQVKIHLAYDSPFRLAAPVKVGKVLVNNYLDLITDKLLAFYGRSEPRDAIDLYFILTQEKVDFWELSECAREKDRGYDFYWMAAALEKIQALPDQINRWPVELIKPVDPRDIKALFRKLADEIFQKITRK